MKKLVTIESLKKEIRLLKKENKKIGFCYGVFDLIHPGHIKHLEYAKKVCDILIVGITSDSQVKKRRKVPGRPIFAEKLRAYLVAQLQSVDFTFIRFENSAIKDIKRLKPHFCIKGEDYTDSKDKYLLLEIKAVESVGGKMIFTKTGKYSKIRTTKIINQIKNI